MRCPNCSSTHASPDNNVFCPKCVDKFKKWDMPYFKEYTPPVSELTNELLNIAIAKEIMGYDWHTNHRTENILLPIQTYESWFYGKQDGLIDSYDNIYHYSSDMNLAMGVAEKIKSRYPESTLYFERRYFGSDDPKSTIKKWRAMFTVSGNSAWVYQFESNDPADAICRAALAVARDEDRLKEHYSKHLTEVEELRQQISSYESDIRQLEKESNRPDYSREAAQLNRIIEILRRETEKRPHALTGSPDLLDEFIAQFAKVEAELKQIKNEYEKVSYNFDVYRKAWKRELGGYLVPKTHEIDALVLTTQMIVKMRDEYSKALKDRDLFRKDGTPIQVGEER
jgi:hypothetical protein